MHKFSKNCIIEQIRTKTILIISKIISNFAGKFISILINDASDPKCSADP